MKKLFLIAFLLGMLSFFGHAQSPFNGDLKPSVSYAETYTETYAWDPVNYYFATNPANSVSITGTNFSLSGVSVDETTPFAISLGDFSFYEVLGDATDFNAQTGVASFPVTTYDAVGNVVQCGSVKFKWNSSVLSFSVTLTSPANNAYFVTAYNYAGLVGPIAQGVLSFDLQFSDREYTRNVYYTGAANTKANLNSPSGFTPTVVLSGAFDTTPPTVSISAPAANSKVFYNQITVGGSVSDSKTGPKSVAVRVNGGPITTVLLSATSQTWSLPPESPALLSEGNNTLSVQATDQDGNISGWTSSNCTFTRLSPLLVTTVAGSGSTSLSGSSSQLTGSVISVTATPGPGYLFDHWEGTTGIPSQGGSAIVITPDNPQYNQAKITFAMQPYASLQAFFVPNPFLGITGNYGGTIACNDNPALGGVFSLTLTPTGSFTGKLISQGVAYPIKGQFDVSTGLFTGTFGTAKNPITLSLSVDFSGNKQITGAAYLGVGQAAASISSDLAVWSASNPMTSGTGNYTFLIPTPNPGDPLTPQGTGYGTATISSAGVAKFTGVLGDGSKFTASGLVTKDLMLNFSTPLYNKQGILCAILAIYPNPGVSDFSGALTWVKPPTIGGYYSPGFTLQPAIVGSVYDKTAALNFAGGSAYLSIFPSPSSGAMVSSTTTLASTVVNSYKAAPNPALNPNKVTLTIQPSTGFFTGNFSSGTSSVPFKGVLFQGQFLGAGLFTNKTQSGSVLIQAQDYNTGFISLN